MPSFPTQAPSDLCQESAWRAQLLGPHCCNDSNVAAPWMLCGEWEREGEVTGAPMRNTTPERTDDEFIVTSGPRATRNLKALKLGETRTRALLSEPYSL
ncbi:unnamed protein product [Rangifer tarandus platyrhynchus]|uniref:Uncharacterized protein n=1 Tax=Rangifer tarandus platyrhynchus TaxID=3082113 RepID=A0AC59Z206_RANTA